MNELEKNIAKMHINRLATVLATQRTPASALRSIPFDTHQVAQTLYELGWTPPHISTIYPPITDDQRAYIRPLTAKDLYDTNEYAKGIYDRPDNSTPTTEDIRSTYATDYYQTDVCSEDPLRRAAAFDRWLASEIQKRTQDDG